MPNKTSARPSSMGCEWCHGRHPEDVSCALPHRTPLWVLWKHGDYTWAVPCANEDDARSKLALVVECHGGLEFFEDRRSAPRIVKKRPPSFSHGEPRIIRLMLDPSASIDID